MLRPRLPRRPLVRARIATSDSKYRFPSWRLPQLAAMPAGQRLPRLPQVYPLRLCIPWLRSRSAAGRRSWTWGCCCSVTVECLRSLQFWADISVLTSLTLAVAGATFALFYAQYFALFTVFGGSTPGMMLRGLRVVSFDGGIPTSRQMVWRSFGYLISAGMCFLGFVWALWDDDQLCWQDRISQTYLTLRMRGLHIIEGQDC